MSEVEPSSSRVILQGEIRPVGLMNLVQLLCSATMTGALRVYDSGLTFSLFLDEGFIVAASAPEQEPLGTKLLRKGRISAAQLERALDLQSLAREKGVSLPVGRILVHQKMVTEQDLEECVFDQIVETICLSLELPRPYFSFARSDSIQLNSIRAPIDFQFALLEAFRLVDELHTDTGAAPFVSPVRTRGRPPASTPSQVPGVTAGRPLHTLGIAPEGAVIPSVASTGADFDAVTPRVSISRA